MIPTKYWDFLNCVSRYSIKTRLDDSCYEIFEINFYENIYPERGGNIPASLIDPFDEMFDEVRSHLVSNKQPAIRDAFSKIMLLSEVSSKCPFEVTLVALFTTVHKRELELEDLRILEKCPWSGLVESSSLTLSEQIESVQTGIDWVLEDFDEAFYDKVDDLPLREKLEALYGELLKNQRAVNHSSA